jgi:hypothetical protein
LDLSESNWQNKLTFGIENVQRSLEDAKDHVGPRVEELYEEALENVSKARESVTRLVAIFNEEHRS